MDQKLDRMEELRALERQLQEKGLAGVDRYYRIQRPVYKEIRSLFDQGYEHTLNDPDKTPSLISVYGEGGVGKSGIVEDLRGHLDDKGLSYILFALDSNIYSGIHSKTIKLLDEIVRRFYNKDRFVFLEYVLISECFHSVWDKGTETIFEENDSIFEKTFIDVAKEAVDKLLDTVAPLPRKLISMFGSYVGSRVEGKIEDELIKKNFRNIQGNEEVGAGIVVETFCKCMNSYLAEEKPLIVILDNSETIYDEFSQESQEQLNDVFLELKNTVWYFSGREPFRKVAEKESTGRRGRRKEQLHVIYRDEAIGGISIDEIVELTLRRGILVENKMITNSMARALNDASGGNLRWINAKIMAMQKVQKNDILDAEKFNEIAQASEKDVLVRLIHTEFKEYRDEEKTFLLYGCIPQATNEFINEVDRRLNDFSLVHKAEQQWYKNEYEDGYIFSPMVALVLQRYIKEELDKGTNSYIKTFIDSIYEVLIGINRDRRDLESVRIGSRFVSLFRSADECVDFVKEFAESDPTKLRTAFNICRLNTADNHIYRYFSDLKGQRLFLSEENKIEYQLKILNTYLAAELFNGKTVHALAKSIKLKIEKLPSVTIEGMRTPRVEYDIDLLNTCIGLRHRRDDVADRQMIFILSMLQTESRTVSDLMEIGYAGYEKIVQDQLYEYDYYLDEGIITDPNNRRSILAYKGRFYQQCYGYLPEALDESRKIMDELVEQTRETYGEESLEMASILKDYHSFARRFRMEEEADRTILEAFKILKDNYVEYNDDNKRRSAFLEVVPILDNLGDWMTDSTWRKGLHGVIEEQIKEILKNDNIIREYRNILSRNLLSSYSASNQYQKAIEFITDTYDPNDLSESNMIALQKAISSNLYFIEDLYRNYPLYVNDTNKERFMIFDRIASEFIDWFKRQTMEEEDPKYNDRRIRNILNNFSLLIDYYRDHYGICQSNGSQLTFYQAMGGFLYAAQDQQEKAGKWYGIERDLERSLLVFLLLRCFDEKENLYIILGSRRKLLQSYEDPEDKNGHSGYNSLRKIWYLDLVHGSIKTMGFKMKNSIRERCILQSLSWKNYVPALDKKNTREAMRDMYYGTNEKGFTMSIVDVASFMKKLSANFNNKAKIHISTSNYLKVWLDSYRNICSLDYVPFYIKRRYKAMLIEMLNNNRFYRDGKTYFVLKEAYLKYLENIDENDEKFWCDYFDIYTSFMSVTSQQEEALEYIKQKVEEVPEGVRFSLHRRLSLLNEQLGLREEALADMKKAIDLLEPKIGIEHTYKEKYISYLQHIRPLFTQSKDALQYMREKRNMFKKQEDIDFDVIYALDDIIRMYDQRTVE